MRLAIVHYHLRRGGVTRVIATALEALKEKGLEMVVLSSGEPEEELGVPHVSVPELAYRAGASQQDAGALAMALSRAARRQLGADPDIWHIHNHGLGKNLNFPRALGILLENGARALLQIHDFAEDGRPGNYALQARPYQEGIFTDFSRDLYPVAPQVDYAVLNRRDLANLQAAGVPRDQVHWLPNIVAAPPVPGDSKTFPTEKPLILYPTRAIRRKNLGELLLMAALYPDFQFGTTLSPNNPQWKGIYRYWTRLADQLDIPVAFAMGEQPGVEFSSLVNSAKALVTTSVGEGFGLAFLEPFLFGKPLLGRDLPDITADFKENGIRLPDLYPGWPVPVRLINLKAFSGRYREAVTTAYASYGQPLPDASVDSALEQLTADGRVDFGRLDEIAQGEVLSAVTKSRGDHGVASPVDPAQLDRSVIEANEEVIRSAYGPEKHGEKLAGIYRKLESAEAGPVTGIDPGRLLQAFLTLDQFYLLRS